MIISEMAPVSLFVVEGVVVGEVSPGSVDWVESSTIVDQHVQVVVIAEITPGQIRAARRKREDLG